MGTKKTFSRNRIKRRVRGKVHGTQECPRLSVFRSNKQIYAQIIDDREGRTLAAAGSLGTDDMKGPKLDQAAAVGKMIAEKAKAGEEAIAEIRSNALASVKEVAAATTADLIVVLGGNSDTKAIAAAVKQEMKG